MGPGGKVRWRWAKLAGCVVCVVCVVCGGVSGYVVMRTMYVFGCLSRHATGDEMRERAQLCCPVVFAMSLCPGAFDRVGGHPRANGAPLYESTVCALSVSWCF